MIKFLTAVPNKIKSKVTDMDWSLTFKFEEMPCNHPENAAEHIKADCPKCQFDSRELWLENHLNTLTGQETTLDKDGNPKQLQKIIVLRGRYDDCMGIQTEWS